MRVRLVNITLMLVALAMLAVSWTARRDFRRPNLEFLPEMVHSPAYAAQAANPNFQDGKTLRPPPPGAIARGHPPLDYQPTPDDALRAGHELSNPFDAADPTILQRGEAAWAAYCQHCHGATAAGDGPVAARGFPPPPSLLTERALSMGDGQMFHIITWGQGNMPPHAAIVERDDRWKIIAFIRKLQAAATQPASTEAQSTTIPTTTGGS